MAKGKPRRTYGSRLSPKRERELQQAYQRYVDERRRRAAQNLKVTPQQGQDTAVGSTSRYKPAPPSR
jgi:hypothetical protein